MIIEAKHSKNNDQLEFCVVYANLKKEQQKISKIDIIELK